VSDLGAIEPVGLQPRRQLVLDGIEAHGIVGKVDEDQSMKEPDPKALQS